MAKIMMNLFSNERGSTLIEFTAVLSILLSLTFAMVDFGRYVYANNIIQSAAQEGARAGLSDGDINAAVLSKVLTLDPAKVSVSAHNNNDGSLQKTVQVDVTYQFRFITPFISAVASDPIELNGSASMLAFPKTS